MGLKMKEDKNRINPRLRDNEFNTEVWSALQLLDFDG